MNDIQKELYLAETKPLIQVLKNISLTQPKRFTVINGEISEIKSEQQIEIENVINEIGKRYS